MKLTLYIPLLTCLCVAAAFAGMSLAGQKLSASRNAPICPPPSTSPEILTARQLLSRDDSSATKRKVAGCSSEALWAFLEDQSPYGHDVPDIARELVDRLGSEAAIQHAFAYEDAKTRAKVSEEILGACSHKDAWAAFEVYKAHRAEFDSKWCMESGVPQHAMQAACSISADKLIECMDACSGETEEGFAGTFPPSFDFRKVLDHFVNPEASPITGPHNLLESWAAADPVAAVAWNQQHSDPDSAPRLPYLIYKVPWSGSLFMTAIIDGDAPASEKNQAILDLPQEERASAWKCLADGEWEITEPGAINPKLLEVANSLGSRDDYLVMQLLSARGNAELDPSWASVPAEDRETTLQAALQKWSATEPTPLGAETRNAWEKWLRESWFPEIR